MRMMCLALLLLTSPLAAQQPRIEAVTTGSTAEFRGLHAVNADVVWASGSGGRYVRTIDGGSTWRADSVPGATGMFFVDVHAFGSDAAVMVGTSFDGGEARIYRTGDGGKTWSISWQLRDPAVFLDGVTFWDARRGIAFGDPVGGAFMVLRTEDGGASWERVTGMPTPLEKEAAFAASGTSLASSPGGRAWFGTGGGTHARVFRTADYGRTWQVSDTPLPAGSTAGIFGIAMTDGDVVAAGGVYDQPTLAQPNVLRSRDGGMSWSLAGSTDPVGVKWGLGARGARLVATSPNGSSWSSDGGRSWHALVDARYNTVSFASERVAWLAGKNGIARLAF